MSEVRTEELKRNILSPSAWVRILFMVFYAVMCWLLTIVLSVIVVAQILISLITGRDNENLRTVGTKAADYFRDMLHFLVYATEEKPWPFTDDSDFTASAQAREQPDPPASPAGNDNSFARDLEGDALQSRDKTSPTATADDVFEDISFTNSEDVTSTPGDAPADNIGNDDERDKP